MSTSLSLKEPILLEYLRLAVNHAAVSEGGDSVAAGRSAEGAELSSKATISTPFLRESA